MNIERAKEITAGCVSTAMRELFGGPWVPLPAVELWELLEANRLVQAMPHERVDGKTIMHTFVDPRLIALLYAFEHYGKSFDQMAEALGLRLELVEDD